MNTNLKSGQCPICNSNEIYCDNGLPKHGERMNLIISSWKQIFLDTYICINCGHFEEFINKPDLDDSTKEKIRSKWKKVEENVEK